MIDGGRIAAWAVSSGTVWWYVAHWQPHKPQACEDRGEALHMREDVVAGGQALARVCECGDHRRHQLLDARAGLQHRVKVRVTGRATSL